MIIKALSVKQPWASFIAVGDKTIETRTWSTKYCGDLLIVSSEKPDAMSEAVAKHYKLPLGMALCIARLVDCRPMTQEDEIAAKCACSENLYAWVLKDIRRIKPFPVKGQLRLYDVEMTS